MLMATVALAGLALGAWQLGQRSAFYRKQSALCTFFERQMRWYARKVLAGPRLDWGGITDHGQA
jgi:hypothetical protein